MSLTIHPFFEPSTGSYSFIVANPESKCCAIIDAALSVSEKSVREGVNQPNTDSADLMLDWVEAHGFVVRWLLDTHIHADRPSATGYLKSKLLCAQSAIGALMPNVSGYDVLLSDGDKICLDHMCGRVIETPGHTPGCVSYQFDDCVFVGDTLFMPDTGTARCDFPGSCPYMLYESIQKILSLPDDTRLYICHDYGGDGRRNRFVTTVAEQREKNIHVGQQASIEKFVDLRTKRDKTLSTPRWADIAIPANLKCMGLSGITSLLSERVSQEPH
ncbi:MAG: MBL fold metallo-hydrolase [Gammaproteobacteria bacterium]|nr:MBL fold metallo-hydrolase [Gammaproteobacteria bacterium]